MNELQIFSNPEFGDIRAVDVDGEAWFVGADVAKILGYAKPSNALSMHVDADDTLKQGIIDSMGRTQQTTVINESGVYSLIILSTLPSARKFKKWVTSEVLPSIRKHGSYSIQPMTTAEIIAAMAQHNVELERKVLLIEAKTTEVEEKLTRHTNRLDSAIEIFSKPLDCSWRKATNDTINRICMENNLNYQVFKGELYAELEQLGKCDLANRQTRIRNRMKTAGTTSRERQAISKIDVIDRDPKLKLIFDGIVRKHQAQLTGGK